MSKPYWEQTPEEVACGRCDADHAGPGARMVTDPKRGLIVACAPCLKEIEREARQDARYATRRAAESGRRPRARGEKARPRRTRETA